MSIDTAAARDVKAHALYRFFDASDALLYIGISVNPGDRWKQHRDGKPWWGEVARITVESHPGRASVLMAERLAIEAERPRYNVIHNGTAKRTRPADVVSLSPLLYPDHCSLCRDAGATSVGNAWVPHTVIRTQRMLECSYLCASGHAWRCWYSGWADTYEPPEYWDVSSCPASDPIGNPACAGSHLPVTCCYDSNGWYVCYYECASDGTSWTERHYLSGMDPRNDQD